MLINKVIKFFDKLEDKVRAFLSHYPIFYGFLGGIGVVLFWRGVWHTTDTISLAFLANEPLSTFSLFDGPISIFVGSVLLLITGVFVSTFIGNKVILSGLAGEKKISEKAEEEIKTEVKELEDVQETLEAMEKKISALEEQVKKK